MQNYKNHKRYYPLHHYVITPLTLVLLSWSIWELAEAYADGGNVPLQLFLLLAAMVLFLLPVTTRTYALKNQNRIIRLEMGVRYFQLTGKPFSHTEKKLTLSQIIALRFAGGKELVPLIEKTIKENLDPKAIKKSIKDWQEDHLRV